MPDIFSYAAKRFSWPNDWCAFSFQFYLQNVKLAETQEIELAVNAYSYVFNSDALLLVMCCLYPLAVPNSFSSVIIAEHFAG